MTIGDFESCSEAKRIELCSKIEDVQDVNEVLSTYMRGDRGPFDMRTEITREQYEQYLPYLNGKVLEQTKFEKAIDIIKERNGVLVTYGEWFLEIMNKCIIYLYTEMTETQKNDYHSLYKTDENDVNNYRGCMIGKCKLDERVNLPEEEKQYEIIIHDQNETEESLAWILLHELGHVHVKEHWWNGCDIVRNLNYIHEHNHEGNYWDDYDKSDRHHEERPEEVFCNMIADTWIGKKLDRYWWRKNMSPYPEKGGN